MAIDSKTESTQLAPADLAAALAWEQTRRKILGVPAMAGGLLYFLSGVVISAALKGAPRVGVLQGLKPALSEGLIEPAISPRLAELRFISHHAAGLIIGSAMSSIAVVVLTAALLTLVRATKVRRRESWRASGPLVLVGGIAFAIVGVGHEVAATILAHSFVTGGDFSVHAVEKALTTGPVNIAVQYISLLAGLSLMVGMIAVSLNAMRVGLITRWMGLIGMLSAVLIFLPIGGETLEIVPAFWLAALGLMFFGRWPGGDPPAWASGEARPWPTQAQSARSGSGAGRSDARSNGRATAGRAGSAGKRSAATNGGTAAAASGSSRAAARRRRKRGSRQR